MQKKATGPSTRNQSAQTYYSQNSFPVSFANNLKNKQSRKDSKQYESSNVPLESEEQIFSSGFPINRCLIQKIYEEDFPESSVRKREYDEKNEKLYKTNQNISRSKQMNENEDFEEKPVVKEEKMGYFRTKQDIIRAIYNSKLKYKFRDTIKSSLSNKNVFQDIKQVEIVEEKKKEKPKQKSPQLERKRYSIDQSVKKNKIAASKTTRDRFQLSVRKTKNNQTRADLSKVLNSMPKFDKKEQQSQLNFPKLFERHRYREESQQEQQVLDKVPIKNPKRQFRNIVQQSLDEGEEGVTRLINTFQPHTANYSQTDKSGFKIKKYKNGVYFGQLDEQQSKKEGVGIVFYFNGKLYEGQFKNDMKDGKGYELYVDNSYYQGEYVKGYKQGKGRFYWSNGQIYDGEWFKGKKHGSGMWKASVTSKKSYIGQWFNGKPHGFGVFFNHIGDRYEGEFKNGLKQGHGTERFVNGDIYVGQFVKSRKTGLGQFHYANGDTYIGEFCNNLKHGRGKYVEDKTNQIYQGSYRNDSISGIGQYLFSDGTMYEGMFENNLIHGQGVVTYRDNSIVEGYWVNGVKIDPSGQQQNRHNTLQNEAARQFASIREKRKKIFSLKESEKRLPNLNTTRLSKQRFKLNTTRKETTEKSPPKFLHKTITSNNKLPYHSKCHCYGHRRQS